MLLSPMSLGVEPGCFVHLESTWYNWEQVSDKGTMIPSLYSRRVMTRLCGRQMTALYIAYRISVGRSRKEERVVVISVWSRFSDDLSTEADIMPGIGDFLRR